MGTAQKIIPHYIYEDYVHWEGNWELIEGFPIAMSPAPIPRHQLIGGALYAEFHFALKKCSHCRAYLPSDYKVKEDTILQPDIMVLCQTPKNKFIDFAPSLVAEILSPSTALRDRNTKYEIYQQQGIKYYLIVDINTNSIEIYELKNGQYQITLANADGSFDFSFEEECRVNVPLNEVWKK